VALAKASSNLESHFGYTGKTLQREAAAPRTRKVRHGRPSHCLAGVGSR